MRALLVLVLVLVFHSLFATSPKGFYQEGLKAYQENKFELAREQFSLALKEIPDDHKLLFNLGLSYFQLGKKGEAIASWRKALSLSPKYRPAKSALEFVLGKGKAFSQSDDNTWEALHSGLLIQHPLEEFLGVTAFFLLVSGWLLIRYWGQRENALNNETPLPRFPSVGIIFLLCFLIFSGLTLAKGIDLLTPRATVIAKMVPVRTAPDPESNTLFELLLGYEVIMENQNDGWAQVTYPGGMTGWVPSETLIQTYGRKLW